MIGFACIYLSPDKDKQLERSLTMTNTTAKWLDANPTEADDKLWAIAVHNANAVLNFVNLVKDFPKEQRMLRISSNVFPFYTHKKYSSFYGDAVIDYVSPILAKAGRIARKHNIKLSMHPGQFCVLASDKPDVVKNSIAEFEYHADIIRMMGYGKTKLDFKCNVHLSGRGGIREFNKTYRKLSSTSRKCMTLENDEVTSSIDDVLLLHKYVGIVLDIHHHWCYTKGQFIQSNDWRIPVIIDSWQGVKPTLHYSYPRNFVERYKTRLPNFKRIVLNNNWVKLRSHSDCFPNEAANHWALSFYDKFDIMCEAKHKNLASTELYNFAKHHSYI